MYEPPVGYRVGLNFKVAQQPALPGFRVGIEFAPRQLPPGETQTVGALGFNSSGVPSPKIYLAQFFVSPTGVPNAAIGRPTVFNLRQFLRTIGFVATGAGTPFVFGGVKYIAPRGFASPDISRPIVINTTANQFITVSGFSSLAFGSVAVSPRFIRPPGIGWAALGLPLVQFPPRPQGWDSAKYGSPTVIYKTRFLRPVGIFDAETGFPRVADRAQRLLHIASPVTTIFGDTTLRLKNFRIQTTGIAALELSDWTELRNRNRGLQVLGIARGEIGSSAVRNRSPSFTPHGVDALKFGAADIGYQVRRVRPTGMPPPATALGLPSLWQTPALRAVGFDALVVALPFVQSSTRYLNGAGGTVMHAYGKPMVGYRYRTIALDGFATLEHGVLRLEHLDRGMLVTSFTQAGYGTPLLTQARRFLSPEGIRTPDEKGANHFVGGTRWLRPYGFEATRWGTRIIPVAQALYPSGFGGVFGWLSLVNRKQYIKPDSIRLYNESQQYFGTGKVHNLRQYVTMYYDVDSELTPPRWSKWTLIKNRNKRMGVSGWEASKVTTPRIENKARVLQPSGVQAPALAEWQESGMVSFRIRLLSLDGLEPPHISGWSNARNAARLLRPAGLASAKFGSASLENRSRELKRIGGFDSAWSGYPFVAPRVREVTFESRYGIAPPRIPLSTVHLNTRYVEPRGIEHKEVGRTSVEIHWNRISPRWTLQNLYGFPVVHNVTPELRQRGAVMEEWGSASVRLQWRQLAPTGTDMALLGKPTIADTRRTISVSGINVLRMGDKLTVTRTGAPPLATQYIWLDSQDPINNPENGHGIPTPGWPGSQFGKASMQQQVLYVFGIGAEELFGRPLVKANSIRVEPGIFELTVGRPEVTFKRRKIDAKGIASIIDPGKPRLSPHTIYAVVEAPQQALDNHPAGSRHYVDSLSVFGRAVIQNRHRAVSPFSGDSSFMALGWVEIHNARQYVYPKGNAMIRMGWHSIPGDTRIEFYTTISTMAVGTPSVARPPYRGPHTVSARGFVGSLFSECRIEHFHRTIRVSGLDSARLGSSVWGDTPYMWRGLHVGPLMPTIPESFNAESFGSPWVSHRIRDLAVAGFDAFQCEYDYRAFDKRMRVRNLLIHRPGFQVTKTHGTSTTALGVPSIANRAHFIRPDGNGWHYRKGGSYVE